MPANYCCTILIISKGPFEQINIEYYYFFNYDRPGDSGLIDVLLRYPGI